MSQDTTRDVADLATLAAHLWLSYVEPVDTGKVGCPHFTHISITYFDIYLAALVASLRKGPCLSSFKLIPPCPSPPLPPPLCRFSSLRPLASSCPAGCTAPSSKPRYGPCDTRTSPACATSASSSPPVVERGRCSHQQALLLLEVERRRWPRTPWSCPS